MDTYDRSHPQPSRASGSAPDPARPTGRHPIIRGLARQWWRIHLVWLVVATPLIYLVYLMMEPTYEAMSLLRAEPTQMHIYGPEPQRTTKPEDLKPYFMTEIQLITSDTVLHQALAKPAIGNLPMIRSSKDPKARLRQEMRVEIVDDLTYLIRVTLASRDPQEAAAIVNAVVEAYMEQHTRYHQTKNLSLKTNLNIELSKLNAKLDQKQQELAELVEKGNVTIVSRVHLKPAGKEDSESIQPSFDAITEDQFTKVADRLLQVDFELMDAQARLETARLPRSVASAEKIRELEAAVEEAKQKRVSYARYLAQAHVSSGSRNSDQLRASILNQDLTYLKRLQETVKMKLAQLEFEMGQEAYRVTVQDDAKVPSVPANNNRIRYMAVAPVGVFFLVLGLFLVREITASRDAAPDATS